MYFPAFVSHFKCLSQWLQFWVINLLDSLHAASEGPSSREVFFVTLPILSGRVQIWGLSEPRPQLKVARAAGWSRAALVSMSYPSAFSFSSLCHLWQQSQGPNHLQNQTLVWLLVVRIFWSKKKCRSAPYWLLTSQCWLDNYIFQAIWFTISTNAPAQSTGWDQSASNQPHSLAPAGHPALFCNLALLASQLINVMLVSGYSRRVGTLLKEEEVQAPRRYTFLFFFFAKVMCLEIYWFVLFQKHIIVNLCDLIFQAAQDNWPSYGSNAGEKKNERMVMPVEEEEEEESSTRRIQDEAQTTTSVVDAFHTAGEKSSMKTVELADISHKEVTINIYLYTFIFLDSLDLLYGEYYGIR